MREVREGEKGFELQRVQRFREQHPFNKQKTFKATYYDYNMIREKQFLYHGKK